MSVDAIARLEQIRAEIDALGRVRVADLAEQLGVSEMTVRRDLDALADLGVVHRVRGGALALSAQPLADRFREQAGAKDEIAEKLVELALEGGAIGLDASTTLQRLATRLDGARNVTAVTNGIEAFTTLNSHAGVTALLTGGQFDPRTGSLVGPLAIRSAKDMLLGRLFVSAIGIDPHHGTTESTLEEAELKLAMADVSSEIVVALDSSKLGQRGAARCLPIDRIDILVTDLPPNDKRLAPYKEHCEVI